MNQKYQHRLKTNIYITGSFQGVNKLFVLRFEDNAVRTEHPGYFLRKVEIKDRWKNIFDHPVKMI